mmetsp:Transcript_44365/g.113289  ORF Transcript_44365/g.113289 Transcript_44365/m.113289 type:complete len:212 (-) Transcript_44365:916-1551(-)
MPGPSGAESLDMAPSAAGSVLSSFDAVSAAGTLSPSASAPPSCASPSASSLSPSSSHSLPSASSSQRATASASFSLSVLRSRVRSATFFSRSLHLPASFTQYCSRIFTCVWALLTSLSMARMSSFHTSSRPRSSSRCLATSCRPASRSVSAASRRARSRLAASRAAATSRSAATSCAACRSSSPRAICTYVMSPRSLVASSPERVDTLADI